MLYNFLVTAGATVTVVIKFGATSISLVYTTKGSYKFNTLPLEAAGIDSSSRVPNCILCKKKNAGEEMEVEAIGRDATKKFEKLKNTEYPKYCYFKRMKPALLKVFCVLLYSIKILQRIYFYYL